MHIKFSDSLNEQFGLIRQNSRYNNDQGKFMITPNRAQHAIAASALTALSALVTPNAESAAPPRAMPIHEPQRDRLERVEIWVNAFIPKEINGYTQEISLSSPELMGKTAIPGPAEWVSGHFLTDQRSFSADPNAKSRMHCLVVIDVEKGQLAHDPVTRVDQTTEIDPKTGEIICTRTGAVHGIKVKISSFKKLENGRIEIIIDFRGAASNPCFDKIASLVPDIDWNLSLKLMVSTDRKRCLIEVIGKVESFPAFEMYATAEGGPVATLFALPPVAGKTPNNLFGGPDREINFQVWVQLPLDGEWISSDTQTRFKLRFANGQCEMIERNSEGKELAQPARVIINGPTIRIERENNDAVLAHLGFSDPKLRRAIIAAGPAPSYINLEFSEHGLTGQWNGLVVIKKADNSLERLEQPGARPAREFSFGRVR